MGGILPHLERDWTIKNKKRLIAQGWTKEEIKQEEKRISSIKKKHKQIVQEQERRRLDK